ARDGGERLHARDRQDLPRLDQGDQQVGALPGDGERRQPELHAGHGRCGVSLMPGIRSISLLAAGVLLLLAATPASAQNAPARDDIVAKLEKYQADLELEVPTLRQQVSERSKMRGKDEPPPQKRPPIAPDLNKLPAFNADIVFDVDTPIVQPESYQTVGRIADALVHSSLLPYTFLVVGHIEANGKRE